MEAQDPLTQLADIHLPDGVGWWPPAPGWWALCLILLALVIAGLALFWRQWRRRQKLQAALDELDQAWEDYQASTLAGKRQEIVALKLLSKLNNILRRVALLYFPVETVAPLSGQRWLDFLQQSDPNTDFSDIEGLGDSAYRERFRGDPEPAYQVARQWIHNLYLKHKRRTEVRT